VWQQLYSDLKDSNFTIIAVAMDTPDAARSWIEAASPAYPCPVDSEHRLADLYNMVNVPQAVWIDEQGRVVRPVESAGAFEGFRQMDRTTFKVPDDVLATTQGAKRTYVAAIRDWVLNGTASEHAFDAAQAKAHLQLPDARTAEAHARFRLGQALLQRGREAEAEAQFAQARELHPDSWNIWRQTAPKDQRGLAAGPAFWARVDALGKQRYYAPVDMKGMPP
jgi:tetratricopeptide (TPR) repeat protein